MKNTVKLLLILIVSLGLANSAKAQFYVKAGVGLGLGLNPTVIGDNETLSSTNSTYSDMLTVVKHSPGEGIYPEIGFGYKLNDNLGVELGVSYAVGLTATVTGNETIVDSLGGGLVENTTGNATVKLSFHSFILTPALVVTGSGDHKLVPYARLGLIISLGSQIKIDSTLSSTTTAGNASTTNSSETVVETSGSVQLGVAGAVGVTYKLSDNLSLFGEINARAFNFNASQSNVTTATVNGADELSHYTTSQKTTNYVNSITTTNVTVYNPGSPSQSLSVIVPASTVGLTIGVKLSFGSGTKAAK